jgi:uncharacterized cupredoxin-like copper-binding protein
MMSVAWRSGAFAVAVGLAVAIASCGGDPGSGAGHSSGMHGGNGSMMDFGAPADPNDANRTIEIEALDSLDFDPDALKIESGDVVTFIVTNVGRDDHEFVLGDERFQAEHEEAMGEGDMEHGGGMAVEIGPGESKEITWRFDEAGEILYGCHEPGHYDGGMVGTIEVS